MGALEGYMSIGKEPSFVIGTAFIFIEGGASPEVGLEILRTIAPNSCRLNPDLTFRIFNKNPREPHFMAYVGTILMRLGISIRDGQIQEGEAYGKKFYNFYLPKARSQDASSSAPAEPPQ